jgi:hypothetical protein
MSCARRAEVSMAPTSASTSAVTSSKGWSACVIASRIPAAVSRAWLTSAAIRGSSVPTSSAGGPPLRRAP